MKLLPLFLLISSCTPGRIITRWDVYPAVTLDRTICHHGKMTNRPVTLQQTVEVTRIAR